MADNNNDEMGTGALRPKKRGIIDDAWIDARTNEELILIIARLSEALRRRTVSDTNTSVLTAPPSVPDFDTGSSVKGVDFKRVPLVSPKSPDDVPKTTWRIVLLSSRAGHEPLGLEVFDDVVIGRWSSGVRPQVDLESYDGETLGVSRAHATLRPTEAELFLVDRRSTNGTYVNGIKLEPGDPKALNEGDIVAFGELSFKLNVVAQPGG